MFKLIRIENSGTHQPEPIRIPIHSSLNVRMGGAYILNGDILTAADRYKTPTHVALESAKPGEKDSVLCYRINENMIFEGPAFGCPRYIYLGMRNTVQVENKAGIGISEESEGGTLSLVSRNNAEEEGDLVHFRVLGPIE